MSYSYIVHIDEKFGIGYNDLTKTFPWNVKDDLKNFKRVTTNNVVIMGRRTWESLKKPLANRLNVVVSTTLKLSDTNVRSYSSVEQMLINIDKDIKQYHKNFVGREKFIIGGHTLYDYFSSNDLIYKYYVTHSNMNGNCDIFLKNNFYKIVNNLKKWKHSSFIFFTVNTKYREYTYINSEELQYLDALENIYNNGYVKLDRTGVGTKSLFGFDFRFNLENNNFPLLTSRRMSFRMIFEELNWFLKGQTNSKLLENKGVHIWKGNTTREFLDNRGLQHYEVGDIGYTYGFLFRHYSAEYKGCNYDYTNQGYDQLLNVINLLKNDRNNRRIMINLWDASRLDEACLPPCCFNYQFYVGGENNDELTTKLTQRSSDISLAGGWNIASGALLTYMLASVCGLKPKELIWSAGDTHIYLNQLNEVKVLIGRSPRKFPKLFLKENSPSISNEKDITEFEFTDFELMDYYPYDKIAIQMNA